MDTESRQQALALMEFCKELGLSDFYRGKNEAASVLVEDVVDASPFALDSGTTAAPASFDQQDDTLDMARQSATLYQPVVALTPTSPLTPAQKPAALDAIRADLGDCTRCPLCETRNKIVYGDGDANASLMFVGEGPGADEDEQGLPFVGRGGQLLNNMINAMGLSREQVYIANIVKCRPPQNRVPENMEANTCTPFLFRQIDAIRPKLLVALGATAATYLMAAKAPLNSLRGRIHDCRGAKLIVTYHPAYLLRDPRQKAEAWKDLQLAMQFLDLKAPAKTKE